MMSVNNVEQACWPDRLQELLLCATILSGDKALAAWEQWTNEVDFENLDMGSQRLLPETYTNLLPLGVDHEYMARMKGVKRKTWLENQLLFHHGEKAIEVLDARRISTMIAKGPALVLCHYKSHGRRPMADFDLVVHRDQAEEAIAALGSNGFRLMDKNWRGGDIGLLHAVTYFNDTGHQFDLHWRVIGGCTDDGPFWDNAVPVSVNSTSTLAPSPTEMLLHVCIHGIRPNEVPPIRWVVDASVILKDAEIDIDWDRLAELATRLRFGYRMQAAFNYLSRFDIDEPANATDGLWRRGLFRFEKIEFDRITRVRRKSFTTQCAGTWLGYNRFASRETGLRRIRQLPGYLKLMWSVENTWRLPGLAFGKAARRLFKTS